MTADEVERMNLEAGPHAASSGPCEDNGDIATALGLTDEEIEQDRAVAFLAVNARLGGRNAASQPPAQVPAAPTPNNLVHAPVAVPALARTPRHTSRKVAARQAQPEPQPRVTRVSRGFSKAAHR
jgi:hypothetical protein